MSLKKAWVKLVDGTKAFSIAHVQSVFYNYASNILLKDKLDEMDKLIEEKVTKAMMSNQQVNNANMVPTSALAYEMDKKIDTINESLINLQYIEDADTAGIAGKRTLHKFDSNTLNTPYKAGLTGNTVAGVIETLWPYENSNYYIQKAYMSASALGSPGEFSRNYNNGTFSNWVPVFQLTGRLLNIETAYGLTIHAYHMRGIGVIQIHGRLSNITAGTDTSITQLSEDYQPIYSLGWNTYTTQGGSFIPFLVTIDYERNVRINCSGGSVPDGYINICYVYACI